MSKLPYAKPTVARMGSVTEKTQGGWNRVVAEVFSWRGNITEE